ncbi:MAG: AmmeMemoRadiSam system protein B [Deltaproteobacteria bacterium]|nr:AmmeMemoRadiSam system protein B [Deltaproteobacteria bacterium]MBW1946811.1 AmmeMemoRadiSam system protein B [Deltaproteobacteria bacterium]MBW2098087.1 AmmeMemoRadiSam system protein B [Deltaproteobacteria bacterium]
MNETVPMARRDLQFIPVQYAGHRLIFIQDHLGLAQEGRPISLPLYQVMTLLDGTTTLSDLQMELMRQKGGTLVGKDEVKDLLARLDESFLLDSERFKKARDQIVASFSSKKTRPCSHCGRAYPGSPNELKAMLDEILASHPPVTEPEGKIVALIAPHIDLSVGYQVYSSAYQMFKYMAPSRIILLGVGHNMADDFFCLTDKDFETPQGIVKNEPSIIRRLKEAGGDIVAGSDFAHRSEHSIEFQTIFLHHLLAGRDFTIIPILCGFCQSSLNEYSRRAYLEKAGPFLRQLKQMIMEPDKETLVVAGVDFSHTGPKFGHQIPARSLESRSMAHDQNLLKHLSRLDAELFWKESRSVRDQYNVCGFSTLACMLEVLPRCRGNILDYQIWHDEATSSAVSFSSVVFTS